MAKIAYLDCPTGIAGDMFLGALVDAGVPLEYITQQLQCLGISDEYQLRAEKVLRNGQEATKVYVDLKAEFVGVAEIDEPVEAPTFDELSHSHHHHEDCHSEHSHHEHSHTRHLPEIDNLIVSAKLPPRAEAWSLGVFRKLADAEGFVHGISPEKVHFHEVGATDAIVDIVGTCLGLDWLGIDALYCSPLPTGGGTIRAAHGRMPVPTPAVLKLFEMGKMPVYSNGINRELVTPTGASIVCTLAASFGSPPAMTLHQVGLGAGSRNLAIPNILRLWVGEAAILPTDISSQIETISVLETQIDDLNPQAIGYIFDRLFEAGALDVFTQPIGMKKSRPGILLTVVCHPQKQAACEAVIFRETTTLGIRRLSQERVILSREIVQVMTPFGPVRVKVAKTADQMLKPQPEYEDCAAIAKKHNLPWREVHRLVLEHWH
ncbi:MAG TPA: nickel pincer cofactor biosynthesis protein LarC [Halomicronema sp.]